MESHRCPRCHGPLWAERLIRPAEYAYVCLHCGKEVPMRYVTQVALTILARGKAVAHAGR